jgi:hypothetical protein
MEFAAKDFVRVAKTWKKGVRNEWESSQIITGGCGNSRGAVAGNRQRAKRRSRFAGKPARGEVQGGEGRTGLHRNCGGTVLIIKKGGILSVASTNMVLIPSYVKDGQVHSANGNAMQGVSKLLMWKGVADPSGSTTAETKFLTIAKRFMSQGLTSIVRTPKLRWPSSSATPAIQYRMRPNGKRKLYFRRTIWLEPMAGRYPM